MSGSGLNGAVTRLGEGGVTEDNRDGSEKDGADAGDHAQHCRDDRDRPINGRGREIRAIVLVFCLLALAGCDAFRSTKPEPTRCPESQGLYCLTVVVCSADEKRGCLVCQCSSPNAPLTRPVDNNVPFTR